jgi:hypothetical protein
MLRHPSQTLLLRSALPFLALLALVSLASRSALLARPPAPGAASGVKIECILPDGQLTEVPNTNAIDSLNHISIVDDSTINCALHTGETTFIITLPKNTNRDGFTLVNENAAACGELRIAVSNSPLPPDSPQWTKVDGIVPFAHKRLFKLSMLGVETRFVRLSFHVETGSENSPGPRAGGNISSTFHSSALAEAVDSHFAAAHERHADFLAGLESLAPLSTASSN